MDDFDGDISNGTCYSSANAEMPSRFIPCGNAALGHVSCCESADTCLADNACFNGQFYITYLAGCTDSDYEHESCPDKNPYNGYTWAGLSYCNGTTNEWIACSNTAKTVTPNPELCWCPETSRIVAFSESGSIANQAVLPTAKGEKISWISGFTPTYTLTANPSSQPAGASTSIAATSAQSTALGLATISSSPQSATASSTLPTAAATSRHSSSPVSTAAATSFSSQSLSTGAKAGIGVGAGVAGIAVLALLIAILQWLARRRQKRREEQEHEKQLSTPYTDQPSSAGTYEIRSPAWSGHKSELAANDIDSMRSSSYRGRDSLKSEVQGSPAVGGESRAVGNDGYEVSGRMGTVYEMPG